MASMSSRPSAKQASTSSRKPARSTSTKAAAGAKASAAGKSAAVSKAAEAATPPDDRPADDRQSNLRRELVGAEILERSAKLFAERGFAATSVQDIAEALGMSRPALYHYVSSKEEILERLIEGQIESTRAALAELSPDGTPEERLVAVVHALVGPIGEAPNRFRLLVTRDPSMSEPLRDRLHALERQVIKLLTEVIESGMSDGSFRRGDVRIATFGVIGMINWVAWWFVPDRGPNLAEISAGIARQALTGLQVRDGVRAPTSMHDVIANIRDELDHLSDLAR